MKYEVNESVVRKVIDTVDAGLCAGVGSPIPGQMCVEAAVCYAFGLPHGDNPPCVGAAVRAFKIKLNDAPWSSNAARAAGMRQVAIAQLGSDKIDQRAFATEVAIETVKQILPISIRERAKRFNRPEWEALAVRCEAVTDLASARSAAAYDADAAGRAARYAYAAADAAYAADAAAYAADAAAYARSKVKDGVLSLAASIAVAALVKLGSEGASYLGLLK